MCKFAVTLPLFSLALLGATFAEAVPQASPQVSAVVNEGFRPISDADVHAAQDALRRVREELRRAIPDPGTLLSWERFLLLSKWCDECNLAEPPPEDFEAVIRSLEQDLAGMEIPQLRAVRRALIAFGDRWRDRHDAELEKQVRTRLERVQASLAAASLSSQAQAELAIDADWLARHSQAPAMLAALGQSNYHPNLQLTVGKRFLSAYMSESIDRPEEVDDEILGTKINGTGQATGFADIELIPDSRNVAFDIVASVCVRTNTVGVNGPVQIYSNGATGIVTRKAIYFDGNQLSSAPARSSASTQSETTGIQTKFKRLANRLVTRIAEKEIEKKKDEGNAVAASHAERDANIATDQDVALVVQSANADLQKDLKTPLARRDFDLRHFLCSTGSQSILLRLGAGRSGQLLASAPPSAIPTNADVAFQLHPSAISNAAATFLAGDTYWLVEENAKANAAAGEKAKPKLVEEKPGMVGVDPAKDIGITFDRFAPIVASMDGGELRLVIRGEQYRARGETYPAMDIFVYFRVAERNGAAALVSSRDPEVLPPGKTKGLGASEIAIRRILISQLKKALKEPIQLAPIPVTRDGRAIGNMALESLNSNAGWMEGGLRFAPSSGDGGSAEGSRMR